MVRPEQSEGGYRVFKHFLSACWAALAVCGSIAATVPAQAGSGDSIRPTPAAYDSYVSALFDEDKLPDGRFGYIVMDAETGDVLADRDPDSLFIPASLSKIATTYAALAGIGGETRLETRLLADGVIVGGTLEGDLHLVGSGDPSLRTQHLRELSDALVLSGIYSITGRLVFHASAVPERPHIDANQPSGAHYNPGISGLNLDHNLRHVRNRPVPISHPARRATRIFRLFAEQRGAVLPKPLRGKGVPTGTEIAVHRSAPVSDIAKHMMRRSTNLTAEVLGVLAAKARGHDGKSLSTAARSTARWIAAQAGPIGGTGWDGFSLANHSGLSTRSRATPRQIAAILRQGYLRFGDDFVQLHRNASPRGGSAFKLRAKAGSMRFVRGYGGFLRVGGREMVFAIMANDDLHRAMADAGATGLNSKSWMRKAQQLEKALLSDWIADYWPRTAGL